MKRYVLYIPYENVCFVWNYMPMWKYAFLKQLNYAALLCGKYIGRNEGICFTLPRDFPRCVDYDAKQIYVRQLEFLEERFQKRQITVSGRSFVSSPVACMFRVTRNGGINNHIVKHCLQTNHHINSAECIIRCTEYYQRPYSRKLV